MDAKSRWRMAIAIPLPAVASTAGWLGLRHLAWGTLAIVGIAAISCLFSLVAIAIVEREQTRRASLPFRAEHWRAEGEYQERMMYARARTRRFNRLAGGERYSPDKATSLTDAMRVTRGLTIADSPVDSENRGPGPQSSLEQADGTGSVDFARAKTSRSRRAAGGTDTTGPSV
jgi:hypothetical protein